MLDIGQVLSLRVCVNLQKKNKANTEIKKKHPSARPGQVHFPLRQVSFSPHLPHRQEPRQAIHRQSIFDNDFEIRKFSGEWKVFTVDGQKLQITALNTFCCLHGTVQKWVSSI